MIFGPVPLDHALGAVLAHTQRVDRLLFKKGSILGPAEIAALRRDGRLEIVVARLDPDDLTENEAAERVAQALQTSDLRAGRVATGRCNLYAGASGLLLIDRIGIDRLNRVHPALTLATLDTATPVGLGEMLATLKVIPFAAPEAAVAEMERLARQELPMRLHRFRALRVGLILTRLPATHERLLQYTIHTMQGRIQALSGTMLVPEITGHDSRSVTASLHRLLALGAELVLLAGAAATVDPLDVLPAAIRDADGVVEHFGMPAEPGNLICISRVGRIPAVVLPSCARSPKANGTDLVLQRLFAGLKVSPTDIMGMGVGGLLRRPTRRPQADPGER